MAMVVVDASCLKQSDSQPKPCGLVWGSAATWRCSTFARWTEWTLAMTWSWWQHYKYRPGYYYYYYYKADHTLTFSSCHPSRPPSRPAVSPCRGRWSSCPSRRTAASAASSAPWRASCWEIPAPSAASSPAWWTPCRLEETRPSPAQTGHRLSVTNTIQQ